MKATIYKDIYEKKTQYFVLIDKLLERIKNGQSKALIDKIRVSGDSDIQNELKKSLPSICFSGTFRERFDNMLIDHSGFICCDLDEVPEEKLQDTKIRIHDLPFVYATWISPRNNGIKFLVKIANPQKHREHFAALTEQFSAYPGKWDTSSVNESRVCFESYDPDLLQKQTCDPFKKTIGVEKVVQREYVDTGDAFQKLLKWLTNKGKSFSQGERNNFIFRLAGACCRFGISEENCFYYCESNFISGQRDFTRRECKATIQSAYRINRSSSGSATFDKDVLVNKHSMVEVEVEVPPQIFDENIRPVDVIFASDIQEEIYKLYHSGYDQVDPIGVTEIDFHYKMKRGEVTLLSGIGNVGKSQIEKWMLLMHAVLYGRKFAIFAPEDNPAAEFFNDYIEILLGAECAFNPAFPNQKRPDFSTYQRAREFVGEHFFFIAPEKSAPTPEYIRERFLELIIKKRVDGCIIDPWNQLTNNYELYGGRDDKYLEVQLAEFQRFAQTNEIFFMIVAHPKSLKKVGNDYPCPDVFDLAGGAMWNNKCHNVLIYHRPYNVSDPQNKACEFHAKKIKKQKLVGKKGFSAFEFDVKIRRYVFKGQDPMRSYFLGKQEWAWCLWDRVETPPSAMKSKTLESALSGFEAEAKPQEVDASTFFGQIDGKEPF